MSSNGLGLVQSLPSFEESLREIEAERFDLVGDHLPGARGIFAPTRTVVIGLLMASMTLKNLNAEDFLFRLASEPIARSPKVVNSFIGGYLLRLADTVAVQLLSALVARFQAMNSANEANIIRVLRAAPFKRTTWSIVDALPKLLQDRCWIEANPFNWHSDEAEELREAIDRLLLIDRPKAALAFVRLYIEKVDSPRIVRLLKAVADHVVRR
jgi:hypothetical protein